MDKAIAKPWLTLQCQMIPGVRHAVFAADIAADGAFATLENWPEGADAPAAVMSALRAAIASEGVEVRQSNQGTDTQEAAAWIVACPLRRGGVVCGAVAVDVTGIDQSQVPVVTRLMLWGSAWPAFLADQTIARGVGQSTGITRVLEAALEPDEFAASTAAAATALAREFEADSVAIALDREHAMEVVAMSGRAVFDRRSDGVRAIEQALDEARDQDTTVVWPAVGDGAPLVSVAHQRLAKDDRCTCTVLMHLHGAIFGGISLSRERHRPFAASDVERVEALARILGPALEARQLAARSVMASARDAGRRIARRLFGAGNVKFKALVAGSACTLAFLALANGTYQVSAPAVLEGRIERDLVAPIDGFVAEAYVRAGARVRAGELLATLDDTPLQLESERLQSERDELTTEYHRALGALDHGATRVLTAQIRQAESRLALVQEELQRIRIVAPFDALVVSGDLSQSLGSPVSRGDALFRLAPLDDYRVILEVEEGDVPAIVEGAPGRLVLSALPGAAFEVTVERMNGMTHSVGGRNVLEVEAGLAGASAHLRPGMKGIARVDAGRARLLWIWTHRLSERVRLWWWAYSPVA